MVDYTEDEVTILKDSGYTLEESSKFYFIEDVDRRSKSFVMPFYDLDNIRRYKMEVYEFCDNGNGEFYEDYTKFFSQEGEKLGDFI